MSATNDLKCGFRTISKFFLVILILPDIENVKPLNHLINPGCMAWRLGKTNLEPERENPKISTNHVQIAMSPIATARHVI